MKTIYLDHGEAYGNLGDEAMLLNAVRKIRKALGEDTHFIMPKREDAPLPELENVRFFSPARYELENAFNKLKENGFTERHPTLAKNDRIQRLIAWRTLHYKPRKFSFWTQMLGLLERCDAVYCVGAANFNHLGRYLCLLPKYMLCHEAKRRRIPLIVSSQTVGPLDIDWTQKLLRKTIDMATHFSVRDGGISMDCIKQIGADTHKVESVGDEALSLPPSEESVTDQYLKDSGASPDAPYLVFHYRSTDYTQDTERFYPTLAAAFDKLPDGYQVYFQPMSYWSHSGDDQACGEAIRSHMQKPEKLQVLKTTRDVSVAKGVIMKSQGVIALSYHVQVFALSAAKPIIILTSGSYYKVKAEGMRRLLKGSAPLIDLEEDGVDTITQLIRDWLHGAKQQSRNLANIRQQLLEVNDAPVEALVAALS